MNLISTLKSILDQTKYDIYILEQIKQLVPYFLNWIDLVLVTENYIICFKDVWTKNNLSPEIINIYICLAENINSNINYGKKYIFMLLTKKVNFNFDNKILNQKYIHIINKFNKNKLIKEISYFLYSSNIFFYDYDNSVIMLE